MALCCVILLLQAPALLVSMATPLQQTCSAAYLHQGHTGGLTQRLTAERAAEHAPDVD